ncbi:MAG: glycosyltransferase, partial [Candidatus Neomicrothrix subdominans]
MTDDAAHPATGPAPLISVLLPVHNGGAFLAEALDSVLSQTLGDLEVIAVEN